MALICTYSRHRIMVLLIVLIEDFILTLTYIKPHSFPSPADADTLVEFFSRIEGCQFVLLPHQTLCAKLL